MNRLLPSDIRVWNLCRAPPPRTEVILSTNVTSKNIYKPPVSGWNAMRSCTSKLYSYRIFIGDAMNPSERYHRWQLPWPSSRGWDGTSTPAIIDPVRLERILKLYEGEHDFVCFAGALEQQERKTGIVGRSTVRKILKVMLVKETSYDTNTNTMFNISNSNVVEDNSGCYYRIDFYLTGALYRMVRNLVGTALDTCRGWIEEENFLDMLNRPSELKYTRKNNPSKPAPSAGLTLERVFYPDDIDF